MQLSGNDVAREVAVFGEAGMFSVQKNTQDSQLRMDFNLPEAADNKHFIMNVVRWLAVRLP